jgi:hypothetical protein
MEIMKNLILLEVCENLKQVLHVKCCLLSFLPVKNFVIGILYIACCG